MEDRLNLITRNLQEVDGRKELESIVACRPLNVYWGTATTGRPHIGYFVPLLKIRDFLNAGCNVTILLADIHAFLDNLKAPIERINARVAYYEKIILALLGSLGVDASRVKFVRGSDFQLSKDYVFDLYKMSSFVTVHDSVKAGAQVVKQAENPLLSSLIYPGMQCLDEEYLKADAQFGGVDQRKIFMYGNKYLPRLGYRRRIHLMNPMMPGLNSEKMSSSEENSKIDLLDSEKAIAKKICKCFCEEGNPNTGVLTVFKFIIFPVLPEEVTIDGRRYERFEDLESDFAKKLVHPADLKQCASRLVERIVAPIRDTMMSHEDVVKAAYS